MRGSAFMGRRITAIGGGIDAAGEPPPSRQIPPCFQRLRSLRGLRGTVTPARQYEGRRRVGVVERSIMPGLSLLEDYVAAADAAASMPALNRLTTEAVHAL